MQDLKYKRINLYFVSPKLIWCFIAPPSPQYMFQVFVVVVSILYLHVFIIQITLCKKIIQEALPCIQLILCTYFVVETRNVTFVNPLVSCECGWCVLYLFSYVYLFTYSYSSCSDVSTNEFIYPSTHTCPCRQILNKHEPVYQAIWAENTDFDEVLISPRMFKDHMPDKVLTALNKVSPPFATVLCVSVCQLVSLVQKPQSKQSPVVYFYLTNGVFSPVNIYSNQRVHTLAPTMIYYILRQQVNTPPSLCFLVCLLSVPK